MPEIKRKPRNHGIGGKLTVLKVDGLWHVRYVAEVDLRGAVWCCMIPGATTEPFSGVQPFATWTEAMAHAATLRTYYGDQCRGDNLIWNRQHAPRGGR